MSSNVSEYEFENSLEPFPKLIERHYSLTIDEIRQIAIRTLVRFYTNNVISKYDYEMFLQNVLSGNYIYDWNDMDMYYAGGLTIIGVFCVPEHHDEREFIGRRNREIMNMHSEIMNMYRNDIVNDDNLVNDDNI